MWKQWHILDQVSFQKLNSKLQNRLVLKHSGMTTVQDFCGESITFETVISQTNGKLCPSSHKHKIWLHL